MRALQSTVAWILATAVCAAAGTATPDWPQWRGPSRNSVSAETGLAKDWEKQPPKQLWKATVGIGFSSFAVSRGLAFVAGNREGADRLYAFDAATGEEKWKHAYPCKLASVRHEGGPYATPTIEGSRLYQLSKLGQLFCLEADTGKVVWEATLADVTGTRPSNYGYSGSPLVAGDLLILNVGPAGAAFEKTTGKLAWKSTGQMKPGHASPVAYTIGGQSGVAILAEHQISGIDPANGKVLWQHKLPKGGWLNYKIADPLFTGDRFFITASYGDLCALFQLRDGRVSQVWKKNGLFSKFLNPVLVNGHVVCGHRERALRCIELATGEVKWEERFAGSIVLVEGLGLILTTKGDLVLADIGPKGYKELARATALSGKCWTPPVLAGGRAYCRNARGDAVCIELPRK